MLDTYELRDSILMLKQKLEDLEMEVEMLKRRQNSDNKTTDRD